jgi:ABC-type Fe3+-siderophore transport system permease subunit
MAASLGQRNLLWNNWLIFNFLGGFFSFSIVFWASRRNKKARTLIRYALFCCAVACCGVLVLAHFVRYAPRFARPYTRSRCVAAYITFFYV